MKYKCIDNLDKFYFRDAQMNKCEYQDGLMIWSLDGVVARYNNPGNETLVDRYIDTAQVRLKGAEIKKMFLEGARYYDANDVLRQEVPDTVIPAEEYEKTLDLFANGIIFTVKQKETNIEERLCCEMAIDVKDEEEDRTDTYWVEVEYEKAVFEWEHFLNKAMLE